MIFKASALLADALYKLKCPCACLYVCVCPCAHFEVPFKRLFDLTSQGWVSKMFRDSEHQPSGKQLLFFFEKKSKYKLPAIFFLLFSNFWQFVLIFSKMMFLKHFFLRCIQCIKTLNMTYQNQGLNKIPH